MNDIDCITITIGNDFTELKTGINSGLHIQISVVRSGTDFVTSSNTIITTTWRVESHFNPRLILETTIDSIRITLSDDSTNERLAINIYALLNEPIGTRDRVVWISR